jgi:pyrimidine deaminase RibD-like protein
MRASDFEIRNYDKLDRILAELCEMVINGQKYDPEQYGMVAAAVLDPSNNLVKAVNYKTMHGRAHGELAAMEEYERKFGNIPQGSIIITTCSPCSEPMPQKDRDGPSCTELIDNSAVRKVYCGFEDPTQHHSDTYKHKNFHTETTKNPKLHELCHMFANTFLENEQLDELSFLGSPCTKDCSGHRAGYNWSKARGNIHSASWSQSFNNGAALAVAGK